MKLHLTPAMMEATYDLLRATAPFRRWKLPEADDVIFCVQTMQAHANFRMRAGKHCYTVNPQKTYTLRTLVEHMAHEMCHGRQELIKARDTHGATFRRMRAQVCAHHGFDPGTF